MRGTLLPHVHTRWEAKHTTHAHRTTASSASSSPHTTGTGTDCSIQSTGNYRRRNAIKQSRREHSRGTHLIRSPIVEHRDILLRRRLRNSPCGGWMTKLRYMRRRVDDALRNTASLRRDPRGGTGTHALAKQPSYRVDCGGTLDGRLRRFTWRNASDEVEHQMHRRWLERWLLDGEMRRASA